MTECGLTDLAICLPQKFFEFLLSILNAPLQPLLDLTKNLLTEPVNISLFYSLWAVIIYVISLFYGLFMLFAGFNFLISGYEASKRENAKMWFRNVILMIIFPIIHVPFSPVSRVSNRLLSDNRPAASRQSRQR